MGHKSAQSEVVRRRTVTSGIFPYGGCLISTLEPCTHSRDRTRVEAHQKLVPPRCPRRTRNSRQRPRPLTTITAQGRRPSYGRCSAQRTRNEKVACQIRATTEAHKWARPVNGSHWLTKPDAQRLTAQPSALLSAVLKTPRQRLPSRPYLHAVVTNHNMLVLLRRMWAIG
jgi:hypothetical protein